MSDFETTSVDVTKNSLNKIAFKQNDIRKINGDKLIKPDATYIRSTIGRPPRPPQPHIIETKLKTFVENPIKNLGTKYQIPKILDHNGKSLLSVDTNRSKRSEEPINVRLSLSKSPDRSRADSPTLTPHSVSRNSSISSLNSLNSSSMRYTPTSSLRYTPTSSLRSCRSVTPRRIFPQTSSNHNSLALSEYKSLEQSSVVFDGKLSFVLGLKNQPVRQLVKPSPSFEVPKTASNYLTDKIDCFLKRTDHVMDEWRHSSSKGKKSIDDAVPEEYDRFRRSRSVNNIMVKSFQMAPNMPATTRLNSSRRSVTSCCTDDNTSMIDDFDELSEMTVDLSEERSNANITNERLDVEMNERIKLTRDLEQQQEKNRELQNFSEKLELDLIAANSNPNDLYEDEDLGKEENLTVFKMKYDRAVKELEFTKRRMQTQHEYDLDQLVGLKKQLEKKLADAYEEVEEQRQVVGQWKRKSQKFSVEMNDLRILLEEQNSRNTLLEKRQRKFDAECQTLQDSARQEKQARERLSQEKDSLIAEKFTLEQHLADVRQELDLTHEKLSSLQRDMEELSYSEQTEEEITQLKRSKIESERKCKEQEDELDEMAGQIQLLEQAKLRLEMTLETMRKEARHEAQQRDDELEEVRGSFFKKIKALECQLENEHEERTLLLREKHELERRLQTIEQQDHTDRMTEEAANLKLKRDLRKYKALFKDAQIQIDRMKGDVPSKNLIRQLRNQLEDAEAAKTLATKSKQLADAELSDVQSMLEDVTRARHDADEKAAHATREVGELRTQLEENEEELSELMKKYSSVVKQLNSEQLKHSDYETTISELEAEKVSLKEQISELNDRLENVEVQNDSSTNIQTKRLVLRTKELESKLELEHATRSRLEVILARHKESVEKTQTELIHIRSKETLLQEELKKVKKTLRETKDELHSMSNRDQDHINKRQEASKKLETTESELASVRNDLRLALQRIADLQQAMEDGDYDDDSSESDLNDLSDGSISPVESTYLQKRLGSIDLASSTNSNETKATK